MLLTFSQYPSAIKNNTPNEQPEAIARFLSLESLGVALLCLAFITLALSFMRSATPTFDETTHLPAGYTYLRSADYRLNPEHPPLAKKWAALPLLAMQVWPKSVELVPQDLSSSPFFSSERILHLSWAHAANLLAMQWNFTHEFLYGIKEETHRRFNVQTPGAIPPTASLTHADFYNQPDHLVAAGRHMMLFFGVALALLIYVWARQLHGSAAAALPALALFAFDPNFIAHSSLVTTDVPVTFFITLTIYCLWRFCREPRVAWAMMFVAAFACAFITKFSAIVLLPTVALLLTVAVFRRSAAARANSSPGTRQAVSPSSVAAGVSPASLLILATITLLTTWAIIWAAYDFRYSAVTDPAVAAANLALINKTTPEKPATGIFPIVESLRRNARLRAGTQGDIHLGIRDRAILFASDHHLLPEAYLFGLAETEHMSLVRPSYLRGEYSTTGFRSYFFWTLLLKTPLPTLLLMLGTALTILSSRVALALPGRPPARRNEHEGGRDLSGVPVTNDEGSDVIGNRDVTFLLLPPAIYLAIAIYSNVNIGYRHILPVLPFLFIVTGAVGKWIAQRFEATGRTLAFTGAFATVVLTNLFVFSPPWRPQLVFPHYLAYFNELAGGPRNGWHSLASSNLDWGQDLKGLKDWLDRTKPTHPIYLSYFGMADPRYYGIQHIPVPNELGNYAPIEANSDLSNKDFLTNLKPGDYIAVSTENFIAPSLSSEARGTWQRIAQHAAVETDIGYSTLILKMTGIP